MAGVMKQITQIIENKFYTYVPGEFLPIFVDGELSNRQDFYAYKAKRAAVRVGNVCYKALEAFDELVQRSQSR